MLPHPWGRNHPLIFCGTVKTFWKEYRYSLASQWIYMRKSWLLNKIHPQKDSILHLARIRFTYDTIILCAAGVRLCSMCQKQTKSCQTPVQPAEQRTMLAEAQRLVSPPCVSSKCFPSMPSSLTTCDWWTEWLHSSSDSLVWKGRRSWGQQVSGRLSGQWGENFFPSCLKLSQQLGNSWSLG